ncbi:YdcF family protein [Pseudonocardia sp. NPDC049635]|uniref:YdcF family protein n=1 Tax=Pseudonocardia sp. NPDC049635 TaxID=3155506 RepID=UPI00340BC9BC
MTRHRDALDDPATAEAVHTLWDYHRLDDGTDTITDVGIGLGSHDLSVATTTAELYHRGRFPLIVFTGANAPTTVDRFPRGEAVHYRDHALALGVPDNVVLVEPTATNTGENITRTRDLLAAGGHSPHAVTLITRPYQQRRARATCRQLWADVEVVTAASPLSLHEYVESIGDPHRVITMLVGDTHRIQVYADRGYAAPEPIPTTVQAAFDHLVQQGYTDRLVPNGSSRV